MRIAVYHRVSTTEQDIASQEYAVRQWLSTHPQYDQVTTYSDLGISGKTDKRPQYQAMCAAIAAGEFDAVVVYRLDRLSRNAVTALKLLLDWLQGDIEFFAVDQPILQLGRDNPMRLTVAAMLAELSQLEREAIVGRVRSGLAAAKVRGVRLGAKAKLTQEQIIEASNLQRLGLGTREIGARMQVSATTISRSLRRQQERA